MLWEYDVKWIGSGLCETLKINNCINSVSSSITKFVTVGGRKVNTILPQTNYMFILEYLFFS
jgi:hypothetical protein